MYSAVVLLIVVAGAEGITLERAEWNHYKLKYERGYKSSDEELRRFQNFKDNLNIIKKHNELFAAGNVSYELGINEFADMSEEDIKKKWPNVLESEEYLGDVLTLQPPENFTPPLEVDWRNVSTNVKNQNQRKCNFGWAFGAVAALESHYRIKNNSLTTLSEQQLIDCSKEPAPCEGGSSLAALQYLKKVGGIETQATYPYDEKPRSCRFNPKLIKARVQDVVRVPSSENDILKTVASKGPVTVSINFMILRLVLYKSGIFDWDCPQYTNHGMVIVGYGTSDPEEGLTKYWLLKNSLGTGWGEKGYIRIVRDKNMCDLSKNPVYPIVA